VERGVVVSQTVSKGRKSAKKTSNGQLYRPGAELLGGKEEKRIWIKKSYAKNCLRWGGWPGKGTQARVSMKGRRPDAALKKQ